LKGNKNSFYLIF